MERRSLGECDPSRESVASGVFRAVPSRRERFEQDLRILVERASAFREELLHEQSGDHTFRSRALEEIEVAHEELRVVEEELHSRADEMAAVRDTLDAEHRRYLELFEAEVYLVTDEHGTLLQTNRRTGAFLNVDPSMLVRKPLVMFVAESDRSKVRDLVSDVKTARVEAELRVQPRSQPARWVAISGEPATGADGGTIIRWTLRCIDEQKNQLAQSEAEAQALRDRVRELETTKLQLERALKQMQEAHESATELVQQKERVLSEVAHELRSPLGTVAGWLHVLTQSKVDSETYLRAALSMTRGVRALARLIEDLVEQARFERRALVLDTATLNLMRILADVIEDLRPLANLKNIAIAFNGHPYKLDVVGDPWRLAQVFRNLLGNAIKFTPDNGVIHVNASIEQKRAIVTITDTGPGIPREALETIFKPFTQMLSKAGRSGGLGLGLSIARRLVEAHHGTLTAESADADAGATFRVSLPLLAPN